MTPQALLHHIDTGNLWPVAVESAPPVDVAHAYQKALQVRSLRMARGEKPVGFKIGFTNRTIWPRYQVFAPIWGTVWDTTLTHCDGQGMVSLACTCQPRLEPELVFGMRTTPAPQASLDDLFDALDWIAPGFEVVQSHLPDWKFTAPDTVADSGLHARLLVGTKVPVAALAHDAASLHALLAGVQVQLMQNGSGVDQGVGSNVLDSPLHALHHFVTELRQCPGAPDLRPGDVVTTGTLTDAWPVHAGESWQADFSAPLQSLHIRFG